MLKSKFLDPNNYTLENTLIELHKSESVNGLYYVQCCHYLVDPFDIDWDCEKCIEELEDRFYPAVRYDRAKREYKADYDMLGFREGQPDNYHIVLTPVDSTGKLDNCRDCLAFESAEEFFRFVSDTYDEYIDDITS